MIKILKSSLMVLMFGGFFSQTAVAQDAGAALKTIADIVASLNHFPSDTDKAALAEIEANANLPQGVRNMANTVANISHAASAFYPSTFKKSAIIVMAVVMLSLDINTQKRTIFKAFWSINHE